MTQKLYICDAEAVQLDLCTSDTFGEYLLAPNATEASRNKIITQAVRPKSPERQAINYAIVRTGYYCIITTGLGDFPYTAVVEFRNAYGELSGAQIAKLPFYGGITVVYAVIGFLWAFLYVQRRNDILPVQNYITATIAVLVVEMAMTWAYYDYQNRNGATTGSRVLMLMVSVLNAARNSFSFFLLLIVCMGYGVVKPTLGKTMVYVRWLTAAHFTFGVLYATASLSVAPEDAGPLMLLVVGPLAGTLTAFYVWTLNSLGATMRDLTARKQTVKASMYRKLWYCIIASILVIFAFFFLNSFTLAGQGDPDFTPNNWQTRWFVLDGWLNLVYLFDVCFIAYLWRPTANNRRFAMSDEVPDRHLLSFLHLLPSLQLIDITLRLPKTTTASKSLRCATHSTTLTPRSSAPTARPTCATAATPPRRPTAAPPAVSPPAPAVALAAASPLCPPRSRSARRVRGATARTARPSSPSATTTTTTGSPTAETRTRKRQRHMPRR